jgi:hypothetical protein
MKASVSADGRWAIVGGRGRVQLVELAGGREDTKRLLGGLESVSDAVFLPDGRIARLGRRGSERGWFLPAGEALQLSPLPDDAVPQWFADGRLVAFYRAREPQAGLFVGTLQDYKQHPLGGPVTGLAWSPWGGAVYALVYQPDGLSSLVRVIRASGKVEIIARDLDAPFRLNSIGVSANGKQLYVALAGTDVPDPKSRHHPEADRDLDLYEVDAASGNLRPVVQTATDEFGPMVVQGYLYWTQNDINQSVVVFLRPAANLGSPSNTPSCRTGVETESSSPSPSAAGGWRIGRSIWMRRWSALILRVRLFPSRLRLWSATTRTSRPTGRLTVAGWPITRTVPPRRCRRMGAREAPTTSTCGVPARRWRRKFESAISG